LTKTGDLPALQRYLIEKFWQFHQDYAKADLSFPIWSKEKTRLFYLKFGETPAATPKTQPTISH
jgi:hypothetical protein